MTESEIAKNILLGKVCENCCHHNCENGTTTCKAWKEKNYLIDILLKIINDNKIGEMARIIGNYKGDINARNKSK